MPVSLHTPFSIQSLALCLAAIFKLDAPAEARQSTALRPQQLPAPIHQRHLVRTQAGWASAFGFSPGADVIYNNTAATGLFAPLYPEQTLWDAANLPGPSNPSPFITPGCATQYTITGLEIGYCTDQPTADLSLSFQSDFNACYTSLPSPTTSLLLPGLPGSSSGTSVCWIITIDLRNSMGLAPFSLLADGTGSFSPPTVIGDQFGVGFRMLNASPAGNSGPIAAGTYASGPRGIRWSIQGVDYSAPGDGNTQSGYTTIFPGGICWDWYPEAQGPHMRLFGDACGDLVGAPFCSGDGVGTPCPCGNSSPSWNREGCRNSVNGVNGGRLEGLGTPSLTQDTFFLRALRLPTSTPALFIQGTQPIAGGAGYAFGDGLRCAGGSVLRIATRGATSGQVEYPVAGESSISVLGAITGPGTRYYQAWYRNSANFCTPATFNLTNGWQVDWTS
jgi:hypothetical protein